MSKRSLSLEEKIKELKAENSALIIRAVAAEVRALSLTNKVLNLEGDKAELAKNRESLEYINGILRRRLNDAVKALTE